MNGNGRAQALYEEGFLLLLVGLAVAGLVWLFAPFAAGLFLALLLAVATDPLHQRLRSRFQLGASAAASIMTGLVVALVVVPVIYLLIATAFRLGVAARAVREWFAAFPDAAALRVALEEKLTGLPLPDGVQEMIQAQAADHQGALGGQAAGLILSLFKGITDNSLALVSAMLLIGFALYFFYRDGPAIVARIKILTPLANQHDDFLFNRFALLASTLTLSAAGIALLQGLSLGLAAAFMDLPWFYMGVGVAAAAFIPVVGGMIVWGPAAIYLYLRGDPGLAFFLVFWGAVINGLVIDNLLRPALISRLVARRPGPPGSQALNHTFLTVLATIGGLLSFGVLGLFFGPMIAAMAIAIFDLFEKIHGGWLDRA